MISERTLTLSDLLLPRSDRIASTAATVAAVLVTALAARLSIPLPWTPVPITGQTLAVLLTGIVLGTRRGFLAQSLYLVAGGAGLPFFAGGTAGLAVFNSPTAGYLLSFPFAAGLAGLLAERGWDRRFLTAVAAMLLSSSVIYLCGLAVLSGFVPASQLLASGLLPYLPGDLGKALLAAMALPAIWRSAGSGPAGETPSE